MYPAKAADVRRIADTLTHDVDALFEDLEAALSAMCAVRTRAARRNQGLLIQAIQHKIATIYGERHGWRLSGSVFPPVVLARQGVSARTEDLAGGWSPAVADHPFFYRCADRRAVAVAAHLYQARGHDRAAIQSWAAAHRLRVRFPTDFTSWWIPGGTTLCVYEPLKKTVEATYA